jgi:hypothetical protein
LTKEHKKVKDMAEDKAESKKSCPLCHKEYPAEDNYCGSDGSKLEALAASAHSSNRDSQ